VTATVLFANQRGVKRKIADVMMRKRVYFPDLPITYADIDSGFKHLTVLYAADDADVE